MHRMFCSRWSSISPSACTLTVHSFLHSPCLSWKASSRPGG